MQTDRRADIEQIFEQGSEIDEALHEAARQAREAHKRAGLPMPVWRDGKTVWLAPDEIDGDGLGARRRAED